MQLHFCTTSIALAAALQVKSKAKLAFINRLPKTHRAEFNFSLIDDPNIEELADQFWRKQLHFDLYSYFEALRYLKARVHEE